MGFMLMPFSELMRSAQDAPGRCTVDVPDDWLQGRSVFGGLQVALALRAMRTLVPDAPLRTLQVLFAAPVPAGCMRAQAHVLRKGKSATHVEARVLDGENCLVLVVGVFGAARESVVSLQPQQPVIDDRHAVPFRFVPGVTPAFTQHFASRWLRGHLPFTGMATREIVVEIAMRDTGNASEGHVLAIADLIPPVALSHLKKPAPGSSMTWMLEFITDRFTELSLDGWRVDAELVFAGAGYTSQTAMIWGPGGLPVALSRQSMVVFG
ncbi:MAG: acyl-CoA thioesterase [Nevskiales bacterium]